MQPGVAAALGEDAKHFSPTANGRLHCALTGLDVLDNVDSISAHVHSKRFKSAKVEAGLKQFGPYIIVSPDQPGKLQCTLTGALINKNEDAVWKHMMGKKFQRLLGEKEAERAAVKKGTASARPVASDQNQVEAPMATSAPQDDEPLATTSSEEDEGVSEDEELSEEGGFWIPPPGARRDEDREAELATDGEDVVMEDADASGGANGHPVSSKEGANGGRRRANKSKGNASSNEDKRTPKAVGPAENAPQKKKRRPSG